MRSLLTSSFTSAKIKNMFNLVDEIGQQMTQYIDDRIKAQVEQKHPGKLLQQRSKTTFSSFESVGRPFSTKSSFN